MRAKDIDKSDLRSRAIRVCCHDDAADGGLSARQKRRFERVRCRAHERGQPAMRFVRACVQMRDVEKTRHPRIALYTATRAPFSDVRGAYAHARLMPSLHRAHFDILRPFD